MYCFYTHKVVKARRPHVGSESARVDKVNRMIRVAFITLLVIAVNQPAMAKRTVKGTITDKDGAPAVGVRVRAYDSDWPTDDDLMNEATTNNDGYYEIHYPGKHYDDAPHWYTVWRPDIYIRVSTRVNGRCDDGEWKPEKNWMRLKPDSSVTEDHPHRKNLVKNLKLTNYPVNIAVQTFVLREDMWCGAMPLHVNCFACADNGDKVEWTEWGFGGPPNQRTRCWTPPNKKCTESDHEKIMNWRLPTDTEKAQPEVLEPPPHQPNPRTD